MTITMFDSIDIATIPPDPPAVAGYVGGYWPTFGPLVAAFPNALHLSIAISASEDADCLDIENGDATPDQAPAWVKRQLARGVARPVCYASASVVGTVLVNLQSAGIARSQVRLWSAHYTGASHLCGPSCGVPVTVDATQFTSHALGRDLDQSVCADDFFTTASPTPSPATPTASTTAAPTPTASTRKEIPEMFTVDPGKFLAGIRVPPGATLSIGTGTGGTFDPQMVDGKLVGGCLCRLAGGNDEGPNGWEIWDARLLCGSTFDISTDHNTGWNGTAYKGWNGQGKLLVDVLNRDTAYPLVGVIWYPG